MTACGARRRALQWTAVGILGAALAIMGGCTLDEVDIPGLDGPSTTGLSVRLDANPDWVRADGVSTSVVVATVRDSQGRPVVGRRLVMSIADANGQVAQIGLLSAASIVTGSDGRAQVIYTAPNNHDLDTHSSVFVQGRPEGTDYAGQFPRTVEIEVIPVQERRYPPNPNNAPPVCEFISEPRHGPFFVGSPIRFQSTSTDEDGFIVYYEWQWDDGTGLREYGPEKYHTFTAAGEYWVFHSVTDNNGAIDSQNHLFNVEDAP